MLAVRRVVPNQKEATVAFDVKQFLDGLFHEKTDRDNECDRLWINTEEFSKRTSGMSAEQVGRLLLEIVDLHKRGLMKNGPAVRVSRPEEDEAANGTHP